MIKMMCANLRPVPNRGQQVVPVRGSFSISATTWSGPQSWSEQWQPASLRCGGSLIFWTRLPCITWRQQPLFGRPMASRKETVAISARSFLTGSQAVRGGGSLGGTSLRWGGFKSNFPFCCLPWFLHLCMVWWGKRTWGTGWAGWVRSFICGHFIHVGAGLASRWPITTAVISRAT